MRRNYIFIKYRKRFNKKSWRGLFVETDEVRDLRWSLTTYGQLTRPFFFCPSSHKNVFYIHMNPQTWHGLNWDLIRHFELPAHRPVLTFFFWFLICYDEVFLCRLLNIGKSCNVLFSFMCLIDACYYTDIACPVRCSRSVNKLSLKIAHAITKQNIVTCFLCTIVIASSRTSRSTERFLSSLELSMWPS